jgi:hypothetical protein
MNSVYDYTKPVKIGCIQLCNAFPSNGLLKDDKQSNKVTHKPERINYYFFARINKRDPCSFSYVAPPTHPRHFSNVRHSD